MKLTKKLTAEIKALMDDYWDSYFRGDLKHWLHYLVNDYRNIGGTEEEIWNSKKEILDYTKRIINQMIGQAEIRNKKTQIIPYDPYIMVHEFMDLFIKVEGKWRFYGKFRLSSLIQKIAGEWKVLHQHGSYPDSHTEQGEAFAFDKLRKENKQLRDAVKQRTAELEHKNRELEIEAALERVRAVAMSMHSPDDLLFVSKALFAELKSLGFHEIRNALINTFNDAKSFFLDYDYSDFSGGHITAIPYNRHPLIEKHLKQIKKANDAFAETIVTQKDLESWIDARRANGEPEDPQLKNRTALYYYFYSTGPAAIGLSAYTALSGEKRELLKRFRNVFELAYQRYADIQKAEAQTRGAQIQLALERVRARTMAMQKSGELPEAANLLFQQIQSLGMPAWSAGYCIWDENKKSITLWMSSEGVLQPPFKAPLTEDPSFIHMREAYELGETFYVEEVGGSALVKHYQYMRTLPVVGEILDSIIEAGHPLPTLQIFHCAYFSHGFLLFITYQPVPEAHDVFKRFSKVFEQTYTRFLDLEKAEAQTRESLIELGLERVRARAMAMQNSEELNALIGTVFTELTKLDLVLTRCVILIYEGNEKGCRWWMANSEAPSMPMSFFVKYADLPFFNEYLKGWKDRSLKWQYVLEGKNKIKTDDFLFNETELSQLPDFVIAGMRAPDRVYLNASFNNFGNLTLASIEPLSDEHFGILLRFAKVFDLTYTRFNDLQKAEAQAREAQIEAALERVRSRSLAMHKSGELKDVIRMVLEQFVHLNIKAEHAGFYIDYKAHDDMHIWLADPNLEPFYAVIPYFDTPTWNSFLEAKTKGITLHTDLLDYKTKNKFYRSLFKLFAIPEEAKEFYLQCKGLAVSTVLLDSVGLYIENFDGIPYTDKENNILLRFGKVFQQAYTRFLDLQKAEAQAREAQIETALEKVRSRSLAMHKSDELNDVVAVLFERLKELQIPVTAAGIHIYIEGSKDLNVYVCGDIGNGVAINNYILPYFDHPIANDLYDVREKGVGFFVGNYSREEKNSFYKYVFEHSALKHLPDDIKNVILQSHTYSITMAPVKNSMICVNDFEGKHLSENEADVLKRFAKVFEQAYIRFLDLKKAEAQAREAQIQLALERVRAKTMAMQKPSEFVDVINIIGEQFLNLGFEFDWVNFSANGHDVSKAIDIWNFVVVPGVYQGATRLCIPYFDHPVFSKAVDSVTEYYTSGNEFTIVLLDKKEKDRFLDHLFSNTIYKDLPDEAKASQYQQEVYLTSNIVMKDTWLSVGSYKKKFLNEEQTLILKRLATEFGQAYTRFLDLQKAEAQAREAKIEASLERVRSKAMAMHGSQDLADTIGLFYKEIQLYSITPRRCGVGLLNKGTRIAELSTWNTTDEGTSLEVVGVLKLQGHPVLDGIYDNWLLQKEYHPVLKGNEIKEYYQLLKPHISFPDYPHDVAQYGYFFYFPEGGVYAWTEKEMAENELAIYRRFTSVLSLTYKRYKDLKEAEAQAREAKIEAALEKVRSRTLAMQKSDELAETAAVLFQQLIYLGISPNRLYINIIKDEKGDAEFWITDEDGSKVSMAYEDNLHRNSTFKKMFDGWKQQKKSLVIDMKDDELQQYFEYLSSIHVPFKGGLTQKRRLQYIAYFSKGFIGMASPDEQPSETLQLLERFAYVFNLTFTRFNDLQIAEAHASQAEQDLIAIKAARQKAEEAFNELQAAQKQLIQSEKMASLGELTAGIAHEIQNPLNFVNNFSEVNKELIEELKIKNEKLKIEDEEVSELINDLKENSEKINHHGKRADAIVKGMLQHSRKTSDKKEPTDINALVDEYVRLSYHGLRAKDKSFNATIETNFDESIGKPEVIPQDIGRVLLNLLNNAFYAVNEKKKKLGEGYKPIVQVTTNSLSFGEGRGEVIISVKDNGNGIPQNIVDKIFQPFFTTKPTGSGTGLGLSLSYDIIKAHGGEIKVQTKEGEGSEFIIQLPVV